VPRRHSQGPRGRSRGHPLPPTRLARGSVPCHGARAARGPHRRDGAACSPWSPTSARSICPQVAPRPTAGCKPTTCGCAWTALNCRRWGQGARARVAPRRYWRPLRRGTPPHRRKNVLHCPGRPPGPGYSQIAGHTDPQTAQGTHYGLLQLRPGPDLPAAGCGARTDVGGPGPPSPLPPHCPSRPGPRRKGHTILLQAAMPHQLPVVGP